MEVTKALIIDEPWISKILNGEKCWEMRSTSATHRGPFGLIRKGSGQVVGVSNLIEVSGPHDNSELEKELSKHHVPKEIYTQQDYKWRYAWHLADSEKLNSPVNYRHKNGAVTWVTLDEDAALSISKQLGVESTNSLKDKPCLEIKLTQGNINNNHFYIPRNTKLFPETSWGGRNKSINGEEFTVYFGDYSDPVLTDIDGDKAILRHRGKVGTFFKTRNLTAGDSIFIKQLADKEYLVSTKLEID